MKAHIRMINGSFVTVDGETASQLYRYFTKINEPGVNRALGWVGAESPVNMAHAITVDFESEGEGE